MFELSEDLRKLIDLMAADKASDLIITAGQPPVLRVGGDLQPVPGASVLSSVEAKRLAYAALSDEQVRRFEGQHEIDSSFGIDGIGRFRVNVFHQQGGVSAVIRLLPNRVPPLDTLGVPSIVKKWLDVPHGIIVTTGPTGSGKSTSQAAMIRHLNERKPYHIVTIEDPIEYTHAHGRCTIEQREVGRDTASFADALKYVFRQSPDVIMIGEMRDRETFESALQLAETGHLVLATLHTGDTAQAIARIVDVFPADQHQQIRVQLSLTLIGILVQQLVPKVDGTGRVLSTEVMEANNAVRNLIRNNNLQQLYSTVQTSTQDGMQTMNASLLKLFEDGQISLEQALLFTTRPQELEQMIARSGARASGSQKRKLVHA